MADRNQAQRGEAQALCVHVIKRFPPRTMVEKKVLDWAITATTSPDDRVVAHAIDCLLHYKKNKQDLAALATVHKPRIMVL